MVWKRREGTWTLGLREGRPGHRILGLREEGQGLTLRSARRRPGAWTQVLRESA